PGGTSVATLGAEPEPNGRIPPCHWIACFGIFVLLREGPTARLLSAEGPRVISRRRRQGRCSLRSPSPFAAPIQTQLRIKIDAPLTVLPTAGYAGQYLRYPRDRRRRSPHTRPISAAKSTPLPVQLRQTFGSSRGRHVGSHSAGLNGSASPCRETP